MKLKINDQPTWVSSPTGPVLVRPFQVVVPVALIADGRCSVSFPAILDTGNSHNFCLSDVQLRDWVGLPLKITGTAKINGVLVPLARADLSVEGRVWHCPDGVVVYPDGHPASPRLPLLGLRTLVRNNVRVLIENGEVTLG